MGIADGLIQKLKIPESITDISIAVEQALKKDRAVKSVKPTNKFSDGFASLKVLTASGEKLIIKFVPG